MLLCDSQALRRPRYYKTSPLQASLLDLTITALNTAVEEDLSVVCELFYNLVQSYSQQK